MVPVQCRLGAALLAAALLLAVQPPSAMALQIGGVACPGGPPVPVTAGSDLATCCSSLGSTYELEAGGDYSISSTISQSSAGAACYVGGPGTTVRVGGTGAAFAFSGDPNLALGLSGLTLDGQQAAGGVFVQDGASLGMQGVSITNCTDTAALNVSSAGGVDLAGVTFAGNAFAGSSPVYFGVGSGQGQWTVQDLQLLSNSGTFILKLDAEATLAIHGLTAAGNTANTIGGHVVDVAGTLQLSGDVVFEGNRGGQSAGLAVSLETANLTSTASMRFTNNVCTGANSLGALCVFQGVATLSGPLTFTGNAAGSGAAIHSSSGVLTITGSLTAVNNTATAFNGGALNFIGLAKVVLSGPSVELTNNTANLNGGAAFVATVSAVKIAAGTTMSVRGNTAKDSGGGLALQNTLTIDGTVLPLTGNTAGASGGACYFYANGMLTTAGDLTLRGNRAGQRGGGACFTNAGKLQVGGAFTAEGNIAGSDGGGVYAEQFSDVILGDAAFLNNAGASGGGLALAGQSKVALNGAVCIQGNSAGRSGGGMFVADTGNATFGSAAPEEQNMAGNTPDGIRVDAQPTGGFGCSSDPGVVRSTGTYFITGPVCSCGPASPGSNSTCGCPAGKLFDQAACACEGCTPGSGACCSAQGLYENSTVACGRLADCVITARCNGSSVDCPADQLRPPGTACGPVTRGPCVAQPSGTCDGQHPQCNLRPGGFKLKPDGSRCQWREPVGPFVADPAAATPQATSQRDDGQLVDAATAQARLAAAGPTYDDDDDDSYYRRGDHDWPPCTGTCSVGRCILGRKHKSGCCRLASGDAAGGDAGSERRYVCWEGGEY